MWVHVVHELSHPIILSHDFIHNHPEVWNVAKKVMMQAEGVHVLWFSKQSKEDQAIHQELRSKRLRENNDRAAAGNGQGSSPRSGSATPRQEVGTLAGSVSGSSYVPNLSLVSSVLQFMKK